MSTANGLMGVIVVVLIGAGGAKVARPQATADALRVAGVKLGRWQLPTWSVRVGAAVETGLGVTALAVAGTAPALMVAISYGVFAAFVCWALVRRSPLATCGCFGDDDAPPTWFHVGINLIAALVAGANAWRPSGTPLAVMFSRSPAAIPLVVVCGYLLFVALAVLPATAVAMRRRPA